MSARSPQPRPAYSYRSDSEVPPLPDDRPILIFDGVSVLCSGFARFLLRHDERRQFRLLAAQTPLGTALYCHLGLPWSLVAVGRVLPRPVRDRLYDIVARNRYYWFGVRQSCYLPDPSEADRSLA